jgi:hypothetical protein
MADRGEVLQECEDPKVAKARKKAEAAAKREAKKAAKAAGAPAKGGAANDEEGTIFEAVGEVGVEGLSLTDEQQRVATARAVTGVLSSRIVESDLKFESFSVMVGGNMLVNVGQPITRSVVRSNAVLIRCRHRTVISS